MPTLFDVLAQGLAGYGAGRQRRQDALDQARRYQDALDQQQSDQQQARARMDYQQQRDRLDDARYWHRAGLAREDADQQQRNWQATFNARFPTPAITPEMDALASQLDAPMRPDTRMAWLRERGIVLPEGIDSSVLDRIIANYMTGGVTGSLPFGPGTPAAPGATPAQPATPAAVSPFDPGVDAPLVNRRATTVGMEYLAPPPMGPALGMATALTPGMGPSAPMMGAGAPTPTRGTLEPPTLTRGGQEIESPLLPAPPVTPMTVPVADRGRVADGVRALISESFEPATLGKDGKPTDASFTTIDGQKVYALDLNGRPLKVKGRVQGWEARDALTRRLIEGRTYLVATEGTDAVGTVPESWMDAATGGRLPLLGPKATRPGLALQVPTPEPTIGADERMPALSRPTLEPPAYPRLPMGDAPTLEPPGMSTPGMPAMQPPNVADATPMFVKMQDIGRYLTDPAVLDELATQAAAGRVRVAGNDVFLSVNDPASPGGASEVPLVRGNADAAQAVSGIIAANPPQWEENPGWLARHSGEKGADLFYQRAVQSQQVQVHLWNPRSGRMEPAFLSDGSPWMELPARAKALEQESRQNRKTDSDIAYTAAKVDDMKRQSEDRIAMFNAKMELAYRRLDNQQRQAQDRLRATLRGQNLTDSRGRQALALRAEELRTSRDLRTRAAARAELSTRLHAMEGERQSILSRFVLGKDGALDYVPIAGSTRDADEKRLAEIERIQAQYAPALDIDDPLEPPTMPTGGGGGGYAPTMMPMPMPMPTGGMSMPAPRTPAPAAPAAPAARTAMPKHGLAPEQSSAAVQQIAGLRQEGKPLSKVVRHLYDSLKPDTAKGETEYSRRVDMVNLLTQARFDTSTGVREVFDPEVARYIDSDRSADPNVRRQMSQLAAMFYLYAAVNFPEQSPAETSDYVVKRMMDAKANPAFATATWNSFLYGAKE